MSNQVSVSLDKRRVEQLAKLAEIEGVKLAQWIENRVSAAWREAFPHEPMPGVRVWSEAGGKSAGRVFLSFSEKTVDENGNPEFPPLVVSPELAQKIAFGLRGIALREVTNFKTALDQTGTEMHIRRQGPGVTVKMIGHGGGWAGTPSMAVDVADCIARAAKEAS